MRFSGNIAQVRARNSHDSKLVILHEYWFLLVNIKGVTLRTFCIEKIWTLLEHKESYF